MQNLISIGGVFALDIFSEAAMPCVFTGFDYFSRVSVAVIGPGLIALVLVAGGIAWETVAHRRAARKGSLVAKRRSVLVRERKRGSDATFTVCGLAVPLGAGLWKALPAVLFVLDLINPVLCRTLFGYFSCRKFDEAGSWLNADLGIQCSDANGNLVGRYSTFYYGTAVVAAAFAFGFPALCSLLVYKFKKHALDGDEVVQAALSWMYKPLQHGKEWWFSCEMLRLLILTPVMFFAELGRFHHNVRPAGTALPWT